MPYWGASHAPPFLMKSRRNQDTASVLLVHCAVLRCQCRTKKGTLFTDLRRLHRCVTKLVFILDTASFAYTHIFYRIFIEFYFIERVFSFYTPFECTLGKQNESKWSPRQEEQRFPCLDLSAAPQEKRRWAKILPLTRSRL